MSDSATTTPSASAPGTGSPSASTSSSTPSTTPTQTSAASTTAPSSAASRSSQPAPVVQSPTQGASTSPAPGTPGAPGAPSDPSQSQAPSPVDWEKRYRDVQSFSDRRWQQAEQQRKQLEQQLMQLRQQQEAAHRAQTAKPWAKDSQQHPQFRSLLERSKAIDKQIRAAQALQDPAARDAAMAAITAGVSPEEQTQLEEFRAFQRDKVMDFAMDPEGTLGPVIERMAQQVFTRMRDEIQGRMQVDRDFDAPHLKPILENPKYAGYLQEKLSKGLPYEEAMEMVKLRAAAEMLHAQVSGQTTQVAAAQEQQRLAKGRAAGVVAPDPASAPRDPYMLAMKEAREKNISPGTAAFNNILLKYTSR